MPKKQWKRILTGFTALMAGGFSVWLIIRYYPLAEGLMAPENMARFEAKLNAFGIWGIAVLIVIQILQVLSGIIPALPIQLAAGLTYGAAGGLLVCLTGIVIGTTIVFLLVKRYGQPAVDRMFPKEKQEKLLFLRDAKKLHGIVFILYLIPALPKDLFTYLAALTPLDFKRFICISTAARIPMIFCDTFASSALMEGDYRKAIIAFCIAALLGVSGMFIGPKILEKFHHHKEN